MAGLLNAGDRVRIHGLKARPELNGKDAILAVGRAVQARRPRLESALLSTLEPESAYITFNMKPGF